MKSKPGSKEWNEAEEKLAQIDGKKEKRVSQDRHEQRMAALYVEPLPTGSWNRPTRKITEELSRKVVCDAVNDYAVQYHQNYITGEDPTLKLYDPDLYKALDQWSGRPELPPPDRCGLVD
jgi:hypothetical protein